MYLKLLMLGEITEIVNGSIYPVNCKEFSAVPENTVFCFPIESLVAGAIMEMQLERLPGHRSCRNNMLLRCTPPKWLDRGR
jgi:hypothetical protein